MTSISVRVKPLSSFEKRSLKSSPAACHKPERGVRSTVPLDGYGYPDQTGARMHVLGGNCGSRSPLKTYGPVSGGFMYCFSTLYWKSVKSALAGPIRYKARIIGARGCVGGTTGHRKVVLDGGEGQALGLLQLQVRQSARFVVVAAWVAELRPMSNMPTIGRMARARI